MTVAVNPLPDGTVSITTPRLLVRAAQLSDAEALHLCFSDAEVMRYWSTLPHKTIEETGTWVSNMIDSKETNGITDFVITLHEEDKDDGAPRSANRSPTMNTTTGESNDRHSTSNPVIGKIGVYRALDSSRSGEISFMLNRSYQRRGLVSEALSAVLDYLFEHKGVEAITTDVDPRNEASIGISEKHGFVLTGTAEMTLEIGGSWMDSEYRTLNREGWERRRRK